MEIVGIVARVLLGVVLLASSWGKLRSKRWPMLAVEAGVPRFVVLTLPAFELVLGLLLVGQVLHNIVSWIALALFLAFLAVVSIQLATGKKAPCNCFGGDGESVISWVTVVRNGVLVALAVVGVIA